MTILVWAVSQFVQPILPASLSGGLVLFFAALLGVIGALAQFKDIVEFFRSFSEQPNHSKTLTSLSNTITGPVQAVYGNMTTHVTLNVTYIVENTSTEFAPRVVINPTARIDKVPVPREAPVVPSYLVGRITEITVLKRILLQTPQAVGLVSLVGMGGIGKTTLAAAVANDPEIEQTFSDGTLWAAFYEIPDFQKILARWIFKLNPSARVSESSEMLLLLEIFGLLTKGRRLLIVLDGADQGYVPNIQSIVKAIGQAIDPECRVLITSRTAYLPGVQTVLSLDLLPEHEAISLLETSASRKFTSEEKLLAREIVFLSGYFPLALAIAGGLLKTSDLGLTELRDRLRAQFNTDKPIELNEVRERSILKTLTYSYNHLSAQEQFAFRTLSVVPKGDTFDAKIASTLWRVSVTEAEDLLSQLARHGLLRSTNGSYRMHDLLHDYAQGLLRKSGQSEQDEVRKAYSDYMASQ
ncbi:MAG: NB-ARC domain-containing protein [Chloroflexota bacterium]